MKRIIQMVLVLIFLGTGFFPAFAEVDSTLSTETTETSKIDPVEIQKALTEAGFYKGPIDGIIGKKTRAAIRAFQEKNGLKVDGVCGPKTWERLRAYLEEAQDIDSENEAEELSLDSIDSLDEDYGIPENPPTEAAAPDSEELKQKLVS
ncbi:MAG: peptidoglycan-binding protein [Candidatus Omnitrophica bacterium]|nr:peptidoglycan-binding protein [Candidatus Omnitrophota bacterium]